MELIGKFLKTLPETTGQGQKGIWVRGGFIIETEEQFPKQVAFSLWGEDKVSIVRNMKQGTQIKVFFSPESREYMGKWYTDLRCFRIDTFNPITHNQNGSVQHPEVNNQSCNDLTPSISQVEERTKEVEFGEPTEDDDLPF